jgi:phenylalanine-4-hydroxylase
LLIDHSRSQASQAIGSFNKGKRFREAWVMTLVFSSRMLSRLSLRLCSGRPSTTRVNSRAWFTEQGRRLNEESMSTHHVSHECPPQEWTLFNGKIPVLQESSSEVPDSVRMKEATKYGEAPRTSLLMELQDRIGVLSDVLKYFWKYDVNVCRIESRPLHVGRLSKRRFDFFVDFEGSPSDANVTKLLDALHSMTDKLLILDEKQVHWFPRHISELDLIADRTLTAGTDLESDHPGFHDLEYRIRREKLTESARNHRWDQPIPRIEYSPEETSVWTTVWDRMETLWEYHACQEYLTALDHMKTHCGYGRETIPQQQDISDYLMQQTNFRMRPVAGLLSSRDFLNGLAFRVFFSTQYIRHHSKPLYTPEPDICHELLGHAPMFADRDFADFSQEIGLASLGASDEDILKLAHCYWHSVEFGLCEENGSPKAYGAGLLSSFGELEYACSPSHPGGDRAPQILSWDPEIASRQEFPITSYQPVYFLAESLQDAKQKMRRYCEDLPRPFFALYNSQNHTVHIDRPVSRSKGDIPERRS